MNILEMKDFHFSYPAQEIETLSGVNMKIEEGRFYVICGRSGSGKSTLLKHFKTALMPQGESAGDIFYCGSRLEELSQERQCSEIGYVFQNPDTQLVTDKVWHELAFGLEGLGYDSETIHLRVAEMAAYFGIQNWFLKNVSELSGGQKQLLNLAAVMVMHPRVLLLDEPTSQLDPIAASEFLHTVHRINTELGVTVLLTEHRLEEVLSLADSVFVIEEGRVIAEGAAAEVGSRLREMNHTMFYSMPSPMRIYAATRSDRTCPYTVAMGRSWLAAELGDFWKNDASNRKNGASNKKNAATQQKNGASSRKNRLFGEEILCVKEIWYRYERDLPDVVQGLSLTVRRGEIFALMGGNGAGKSTALRLMSGILQPHRGKIYLAGKMLSKYSKKELYGKKLGILPQDPTSVFAKKTVREELCESLLKNGETVVEYEEGAERKIGKEVESRSFLDNKQLAEIIDFLGLRSLLERHPYDLSGGEQQKVALAKVLLCRPELLLLDEPTKGLDSYFKYELGQRLRTLSEQGMTIILVSHDIEFCAEYASRAGLFFEGRLTSVKESKEFFAGNHFYTTAANRMARSFFKNAVTVEEVVEELRQCGVFMQETEAAEILSFEAEPVTAEERSENARIKVADMEAAEMKSTMSDTAGAERKRRGFTQQLVLLAVLTALAVAGRAAFFMLPSIKPMAAVTIVSAVSLGPWQGFLVGALSMLTSNMLFGQGPWTVWQMLAMGLVGLFAGFIFYRRKKLWKRRFLCTYGFVSVILCYGMLMNTASLFMASYELNAQNLRAMYLSGLPVDLVHAGSTVLFLMVLGKPMLEQLERIKKKMQGNGENYGKRSENKCNAHFGQK